MFCACGPNVPVSSLARTPHDVRGRHDGIAVLRRPPDDVRAPHDVGAPDDVGAPHDVRGPNDVVAGRRAAGSAPHDVLTAEGRRAAPRDVRIPRGAARIERPAAQELVAPDDLFAPRVGSRVRVARVRTSEELRQLHGPLRIQKACTLGERVVVVGLRGVLKDGLHQVRRQKGVRLQHQRDRTADHGRGHARAGQRQIRLVRRRQSPVEQIGGAGRVEEARRIAERHDAASGRDNVRLGLEVDRRGAARAVGRNDVIGAGHGAVAVGSPDREHPGCVAGCGYAAGTEAGRRPPSRSCRQRRQRQCRRPPRAWRQASGDR